MSHTAPPSTDKTVANVARAYDYVLGGRDNFEVDRKFAESVMARDPQIATTAKVNRQFGRRVTDYIARQGVRQFLDLGSGIPTSPPNVHDTAREVHPDATVVYVDHDPVVVGHNRIFRATGPGLAVIEGNLHSPAEYFHHPELLDKIDLSQPLGVHLLSVLQNSTQEAALRTIRAIREKLAEGSYLAISHISARTPPDIQRQMRTAAGRFGYPSIIVRDDAQIAELFEGFELAEPGIVDLRDWHPDTDPRPDINTIFLGGIARL